MLQGCFPALSLRNLICCLLIKRVSTLHSTWQALNMLVWDTSSLAAWVHNSYALLKRHPFVLKVNTLQYLCALPVQPLTSFTNRNWMLPLRADPLHPSITQMWLFVLLLRLLAFVCLCFIQQLISPVRCSRNWSGSRQPVSFAFPLSVCSGADWLSTMHARLTL